MGGDIVDSKWDRTSTQQNFMCGFVRPTEPGVGCDDDQGVSDQPCYWFDQANPPMNAWSALVWMFQSDSLPLLR